MEESASFTVAQITTGHFREMRGYHTYRTKGTGDWLVVYTLGGKGRFGYMGGELTVQEGDFVALKPRSFHDYGVEPTLERWEFLFAHVQPRSHWLEWLKLPEVAQGLLYLNVPVPSRAGLEGLFLEVDRLANSGRAHHLNFAMNALEKAILVLDTLKPEVPGAEDARILKAKSYLREHLGEKITLAELAQACNLSVSRFSHLFREETGLTPLSYLELERLERAKQLLSLTSKRIQAIAEEVGFEDSFYFARRFRRRTGLTPRAFRERTFGH